jgi:peptidoglycan/LPS O-acetylase OafA/YrhL
MKRLYYLDYLKVALTVLVVFHHAALPYSPGSEWAYTTSHPEEMMPWMWHFLSTNASYFMGLFFLIAGYFVPRSFDRQGTATFIQKKLMRLGVPLVIITTLLTLLTSQLEVGHLWYVESLLLFCLVYALVRQFIQPVKAHYSLSLVGLLAVALVMGVGGYLIRQVSPQDNWIWGLGVIHIEPAHYLQYVMMFILGILAYRFQWFSEIKNTTGRIALLIGVAFVVGNLLRDNGAWNLFVYQWFGIYESLLCVFLSYGLLWLFSKYAHRPNRFLDWCAQQAYGAYIVHLFILLFVQNATDQIVLPGIVKFFLIATIASILSFLFTYLLRLIPGVKRVL